MKRRKLNPLADPVFKRVFGEEKELLMDLINAAIGLENPVIEIEYLTNELLPEANDDKSTIVDVRCTDSHNRHFILEMQLLHQHYFQKRVFFNAARVYGRQIRKGFNYESLQPVYALCFLDHDIELDTPDWRHKYVIAKENNPNKKIPELEIHFIELSKCRKRSNFNMHNPLDRWIRFFIDPTFIKQISMEKDYEYPFLKKAVLLLDESNYTPGQLYSYDKYLDSILSWNSSMKHSFEEGIAEGEAKGIIQGTHNLAQALKDLKAGKSPEEVAAAYNFELSYIQELFQQLMEN